MYNYERKYFAKKIPFCNNIFFIYNIICALLRAFLKIQFSRSDEYDIFNQN